MKVNSQKQEEEMKKKGLVPSNNADVDSDDSFDVLFDEDELIKSRSLASICRRKCSSICKRKRRPPLETTSIRSDLQLGAGVGVLFVDRTEGYSIGFRTGPLEAEKGFHVLGVCLRSGWRRRWWRRIFKRRLAFGREDGGGRNDDGVEGYYKKLCSIHVRVFKDELLVEEKVTKLLCCHHYHGDCIVPWLGIRNTCPICRYELPTDDRDYSYINSVYVFYAKTENYYYYYGFCNWNYNWNWEKRLFKRSIKNI